MTMGQKLAIVFIILGGVFIFVFKFSDFSGGLALISTTPASPSINACASHGGVNCNIVNKDASITCNDGTLDSSAPIYAVPQCVSTVSKIFQDQFDFVGKSGCYPPSQMACSNLQSFTSLQKLLDASGLSTSELGQQELTDCAQQIQDYSRQLISYRQCLAQHNNPNFQLPAQQITQPLLKAIFCPIFYGGNVSYDDKDNLCVCDSGYFMSGGQCVSATTICQNKYGPSATAQNGNCSCASGYKFNSAHTQCVRSK